MVRRKRAWVVFSALASLSLLFGCSGEQTITLQENGSGTAQVAIELDPVFAAYLSDLNVSMGGSGRAPVFDGPAVRQSLEAQPGLRVVELSVPTRRRLELELAFESVDDLLSWQGERIGDFLRFERTASYRRLAARIDRRAIDHFASIAGVDPLIRDSLVPPDLSLTPAEYRDYLAWAFEEYAEDRPLDVVFRNSRVVTTVIVDGSVVQLRGGEADAGGARFVTNLVEAVTTERPLEYSLVYSPRP
jgi:hypothetical protein